MGFGTEVGLGPGDIVFDGDPATPTERGTATPLHFSAHVYCGQTVIHLSNCLALVIHREPQKRSQLIFVCNFVKIQRILMQFLVLDLIINDTCDGMNFTHLT